MNTSAASEDPGSSPPPLGPGPLNSQRVLPETNQSCCAVPEDEDWVSGAREPEVGMSSEAEECKTWGASTLCSRVGD